MILEEVWIWSFDDACHTSGRKVSRRTEGSWNKLRNLISDLRQPHLLVAPLRCEMQDVILHKLKPRLWHIDTTFEVCHGCVHSVRWSVSWPLVFIGWRRTADPPTGSCDWTSGGCVAAWRCQWRRRDSNAWLVLQCLTPLVIIHTMDRADSDWPTQPLYLQVPNSWLSRRLCLVKLVSIDVTAECRQSHGVRRVLSAVQCREGDRQGQASSGVSPSSLPESLIHCAVQYDFLGRRHNHT